MNSNTLPEPPVDAAGWPWSREIVPLPDCQPDGSPWPKISIVTPSFNQGNYLEETIRSVLLQGYPNLEFIIMDGGSTDGSVDVIKKYADWIDYWVSEPDGGQSNAINRGFDKSSGEIINWLCSDDLLMPSALSNVAAAFSDEEACDVVVGSCRCIDETEPENDVVENPGVTRVQKMPYAFAVWQPSVFFRRGLVGRSEWVRRDLHFTMDRELWCQLCKSGARWKSIDDPLSINRFTGENKSLVGRRKIIDEIHEIYRNYESEPISLTFWLRNVWVPIIAAQRRLAPGSIGQRCLKMISRGVTFGLRVFYQTDKIRVIQKEFYSFAA